MAMSEQQYVNDKIRLIDRRLQKKVISYYEPTKIACKSDRFRYVIPCSPMAHTIRYYSRVKVTHYTEMIIRLHKIYECTLTRLANLHVAEDDDGSRSEVLEHETGRREELP